MKKSKAGIISLIIIVIVVIGSIGAFFAISKGLSSKCTPDEKYDDKLEKCIPKCYTEETGKIYNYDVEKCICPHGKLSVDGICKTNCESIGKKSCGDNCYVPEDQQCINNTTICDIIRYNPETGKCCKLEELYNPNSKKCINCPKDYTMCTNKCCNKNEQCVDNTCCNKDDIHNDKCCKTWASEDGCCDNIPPDGGNGEKITSDGKNCLVTCKDKKTKCNLNNFDINSETCSDEITTYDTNGNPIVKSVCVKKSCKINEFSEIEYDPPHITSKDGQKSVHVCKLDNNKSTPLAYCAVGGISGYNKKALSWTKDANCSVGDCESHIGSIGAVETLFTDIPDNEGHRFCTADISCSHAEGTGDKCNGKCPAQDESQCCQVSGKYNGLVCPDHMICINGDKCVEKHCDNCKNNFCSESLFKWHKTNKTCPICRAEWKKYIIFINE